MRLSNIRLPGIDDCLLVMFLLLTIWHSAHVLALHETWKDGAWALAAGTDIGIARAAYVAFKRGLPGPGRAVAAFWLLFLLGFSYGLNTAFYIGQNAGDSSGWLALVFPLSLAACGAIKSFLMARPAPAPAVTQPQPVYNEAPVPAPDWQIVAEPQPVKKLKRPEPPVSLAELLADVNLENRHEAVSTGSSIGSERVSEAPSKPEKVKEVSRPSISLVAPQNGSKSDIESVRDIDEVRLLAISGALGEDEVKQLRAKAATMAGYVPSTFNTWAYRGRQNAAKAG